MPTPFSCSLCSYVVRAPEYAYVPENIKTPLPLDPYVHRKWILPHSDPKCMSTTINHSAIHAQAQEAGVRSLKDRPNVIDPSSPVLRLSNGSAIKGSVSFK